MADPTPVAPDDPTRRLVAVDPDGPGLLHLGVVGDTYTFLLTGEDTGGRYSLIDMLVPAGGGPPPHRHDFEEMFHVLEGEVEVVFRGESTTAQTGQTVNIPALAPHGFRNVSGHPARLLCMVTPPGLEQVFQRVGDVVPSRTSPAPVLDLDDLQHRLAGAADLMTAYRIENLPPEGAPS
jgi:quercetin dioxygenase-like cupin family protein